MRDVNAGETNVKTKHLKKTNLNSNSNIESLRLGISVLELCVLDSHEMIDPNIPKAA